MKNKQTKKHKKYKAKSMKLYNIGIFFLPCLYMKGEQWELIEITKMIGAFVTTNG